MQDKADCLTKRWDIEYDEEWREISNEAPWLTFKSDWKVKVIPPWAGAMARFVVEKNGKSVSVYYDVYDRLGFYGEPYFEAYPIYGDTQRYGRDEVDTMMKDIDEELNRKDDVDGRHYARNN